MDRLAELCLVRQFYPLGKVMRDAGFQFLPRHSRGQHGQRVAKINHLIQAAAEEIGRVALQTISARLPENNAFRG
jgi:hypothetical protein